MPFVRVGDIEVYYERGGSGPRLLFISGTGGDLRRRPSVFERPIARHFEILTYDQRGLGQTSKPDREYTMAEYAADAVGLLDAVGWDRCHVMGVSFGGMVAQEMAIRYPMRVDRVVLACTSSGGAGKPETPTYACSGRCLLCHDGTESVSQQRPGDPGFVATIPNLDRSDPRHKISQHPPLARDVASRQDGSPVPY